MRKQSEGTEYFIEYRVKGANWTLRFSREALEVLRTHVQRRLWSKESVGQLYSHDLTQDCITITTASTLPRTWASYSGVQFDTAAAAKERSAMFAQELHCVGLWHSHPQAIPQPSGKDDALAADHAKAAQPVMSGLVFVIIGTMPFPEGLGVWVHDGNTMWEARAIVTSGAGIPSY